MVKCIGGIVKNSNELCSLISRQILLSGPLSIADYMYMALHHPRLGYYKKDNIIGSSGDFVTSPEISQIFGEMIAVWIVNEWKRTMSNQPFRIVELGPGRGTLMSTMLKALTNFPDTYAACAQLHMVEKSESLRQSQRLTLDSLLQTLGTKLPLSWVSSLESLPHGMPSFFVANEFFDALPIHRFQKIDGKWREVMVDTCLLGADAIESATKLRLVAAPFSTPAMSAYLHLAEDLEDRDAVEICPEAGSILQQLSGRIGSDGGAALIIDYGHYGEKDDTLRAFRNHQMEDPLANPGEADITADVNFAFLKKCAESVSDKVIVHGPVTQAYFLVHMGFLLRLKVLVDKMRSIEERRTLISGAEMLIQSHKMGERFKFLSILPNSLNGKEYIPAGFYPTWTGPT